MSKSATKNAEAKVVEPHKIITDKSFSGNYPQQKIAPRALKAAK
jgi:hypothetical protein